MRAVLASTTGAPRPASGRSGGRRARPPTSTRQEGTCATADGAIAALGGGLAVRELPARSREVAGVAVRVALEGVLVIGLRLPEGHGLADVGHHLAGPEPRGLDVGDRVLGDLALLVARVEDLGAVAGADVAALAVLCRRVVDLEEELEDVPVGDALGVEDDLDRLGVTRMVPVGRVVVLPARVSDPGGDDSIAAAQQLLDAPEAAPGEDGGLGVVAHRGLLALKFCVKHRSSERERVPLPTELESSASRSSTSSRPTTTRPAALPATRFVALSRERLIRPVDPSATAAVVLDTPRPGPAATALRRLGSRRVSVAVAPVLASERVLDERFVRATGGSAASAPCREKQRVHAVACRDRLLGHGRRALPV